MVEEGVWGPGFTGFLEHARESQSGFEEGPAVEPEEIDGGRLDVVIDFEGESLVGGSAEGASDGSGAFSERKFAPCVCVFEQGIELGIAFERDGQRQ